MYFCISAINYVYFPHLISILAILWQFNCMFMLDDILETFSSTTLMYVPPKILTSAGAARQRKIAP